MQDTDNCRTKAKLLGGLEQQLANCSLAIKIIGYTLSILCVFALRNIIGIYIGLALACLTYILQLIFTYLAESLRLKKLSLKLPYSGSISAATPSVIEVEATSKFGLCDTCGDHLHSDQFCQQCLTFKK